MTRRYHVNASLSARKDISRIEQNLVEHYGPEFADQWEVGFLKALEVLSYNPMYQVQERETRLMGRPIRRYLYKVTPHSKNGYFIYYSLVEAEIPDPEPETDYFAGIINIAFIRPASSKNLSAKEILERSKDI
jgi:hypothetical protein